MAEDLRTGTHRKGETEVRELVESWVRSVDAADLPGMWAGRAADVVMFDVPRPEDGLRGLQAVRSSWEPFRDYVRSGARFRLVEMHVEAGDDLAWAWALLRCGTDEELAADPSRRLRLTVALRRSEGGWQVAHEHHSFTQR